MSGKPIPRYSHPVREWSLLLNVLVHGKFKGQRPSKRISLAWKYPGMEIRMGRETQTDDPNRLLILIHGRCGEVSVRSAGGASISITHNVELMEIRLLTHESVFGLWCARLLIQRGLALWGEWDSFWNVCATWAGRRGEEGPNKMWRDYSYSLATKCFDGHMSVVL